MEKRLKSKIVSIALVMLLCLSGFFALFFAPAVVRSNAEGENNGIRFKQVAVGTDFAIGLTYDGELYGWDLVAGLTANALGVSYGTNPTKIPVEFKDAGDGIIKIAATRTSAAFITHKNKIYTWGTNSLHTTGTGLLLRSDSDTSFPAPIEVDGNTGELIDVNMMKPGVRSTDIGYENDYYGGAIDNDPDQFLDIVGSDDHYVVRHKRSGVSNYYFAWGSANYMFTRRSMQSDNSVAASVFTFNENWNSSALAVGGGSILIGGNSGLYMRGKNFYLPTGVDYTQKKYAIGETNNIDGNPSTEDAVRKIINLDNTLNLKPKGTSNQIDIQENGNPNSVSGGNYSPYTWTENHLPLPFNGTGVDNGWLVNEALATSDAKDGAFDFYNVDLTGSLVLANGSTELLNAFGKVQVGDDANLSVSNSVLSLGNGFGYAIDSNGKLWFFGNGYNRQSGSIADADLKAYSSLTEITGSFGKAVSVVAGKTKMGNKIVNTLSDPSLSGLGLTIATDTNGIEATIGGFGDEYLDGDEFLSGMITENGVYVWNKSMGITSINEKLKIYGVNTEEDSTNKVAQLYAGYGGHMIAITTYGKILQIDVSDTAVNIDGITVTLKDNFRDRKSSSDNPTAVTNYSVRTGNRIDFAVSNGRPLKDSDGEQKENIYTTLTLAGKTDVGAASEDTSIMAESTVYENIISSNAIGDSYRILTGEDNNLPTRHIISNNLLGTQTTVPETGAPLFFFEGETDAIEPEVLEHYFKWDFVNTGSGATSDVGIKIIPYQSTQGKTIVMRYYVARCASESLKSASVPQDVNADASTDFRKYKFYDYAAVDIRITIANTEASFAEFSNRLNGDESNISVPVLDINNPYNNAYSIALTNVQFGLSALARYFGVEENIGVFDSYVVDKAYEADAGFPASQRVKDAFLARYYKNNEQNNYFTDKYQYFMSDPDGDKVSFVANEIAPSLSGTSDYFSAGVVTVEFDIPLSGKGFVLNVNSDNLHHFNNIYGFEVSLSNVDGDDCLHIKYDVLRLTAKKAMGGDLLRYEDDNDLRSPAINGEIDNMCAYTIVLSETYTDATGTHIRNNSLVERGRHRVPAYVQGSMIMTAIDGTEENGASYYRSEAGHNVYTFPTQRLTVGDSVESNRVFTFNLRSSGLFRDYTNIFLTSYSGERYDEWNIFKEQFDSVLTNVTLNSDTFTFEAKEAGEYNDIKIELRRFTTSTTATPIKTGEGNERTDAEVITLVFNISVQESAFLSSSLFPYEPPVVGSLLRVPVSTFTKASNVTFGILGANNEKYCYSTDKSVATVSISDDGQELIITPVSSGYAQIIFQVFQYGLRSKSGSFSISVAGRSIMDKEIALMDTETIYLADFKAAIAHTITSFKFDDYTLDKSDASAPDGYYFMQENPETHEYEVVAQPNFIKNVSVLQNNRVDNALLLSLVENYAGSAMSVDTMLVVKFTDDSGANKYESAVKIRPAKKKLYVGNDVPLVINVSRVNKQVQAVSGQLGKPDDNGEKYVIALSELDAFASDINYFDSYFVQIAVPVADNAYEYFDIVKSNNLIEIVPKRNTSEPLAVNVVISSNNTNLRYILSFDITVSGIVEVLTTNQYIMIWVIVAICVFVVLLIVFIIRMGIYWKKKAEQKRIIRKNQMLIKLRDKVHGKGESSNKEKLVQTKLKLEDPKYAKMFNEMKKEAEESKITIEDAPKKGKKKGKKSGKKSIEELRAEIDAKREAMNKMQMEGVAMPVDDIPVEPAGFGTFDNGTFDGMVGDDMNNSINSDENILFDVETLDDNK